MINGRHTVAEANVGVDRRLSDVPVTYAREPKSI